MSMESQFMARAGMLAGPGGLAPSSPAARYVLPQFEERTAYGFKRQDPYTKLFEDRIIFLGVQVDDASADDVMAQLLVLESTGPGPRHHPVHQLARWLVHGADGDLRHDAVHQAAHPDRLPRAGRLGGRGAARGGLARQAPRAAERARADPPARDGGWRLRAGVRHRDPRQRADPHARVARADDRAPHRPGHRAGPQGHRARQDPHRRSRRWSTGSSTRCSPAARASSRRPCSPSSTFLEPDPPRRVRLERVGLGTRDTPDRCPTTRRDSPSRVFG